MQVRDGMSSIVLTVGPDHNLREAARQMAKRGVGAAVVIDPDEPGPGIITERDILDSLGGGQSPDTEKVSDHLTPHWSSRRRTGRSSARRPRWCAAGSAT